MEQKKNALASVFNLVGGMSGLLSIALLIWKGGALMQKVDDHDRRILTIESNGSGALIAHDREDKTHHAAADTRLTRLEDGFMKMLENVAEIRSDTRSLNVKFDAMKEQLARKP